MRLQRSAWERIRRGKVHAKLRLLGGAQGAGAPTGEGRGAGHIAHMMHAGDEERWMDDRQSGIMR